MNEIKIVPVNKDLISKIRTQISVVEKQNMLIQNKEVWNRLCASLDCIEDSMWAVQYYIESNYPNDFRGKYLFTYGLLQAVFLQQDALNHIHLSLFGEDLNYKSDYPNLYKIREIRNDVTGHPTERTKGGKNYYIYLNQGSMKKWGFEYLVCSDDTNFKYINIAEVLSSQNQSINNILQKAVTQLNKEFKEYINMHKDKKMLDIFKGLNYTREKLLVPRDVDHCLKTSFLESIKEMVEACKTELNRRYVSWDKMYP